MNMAPAALGHPRGGVLRGGDPGAWEPTGRIQAWRLQKLWQYRHESDQVTRHQLSRLFSLDELELIPAPEDAPFALWVGMVEAAGWIIDWDAL